MSLTTARDFIVKAYKKIGIGAEGEGLSPEMMNDALDEINMLISAWSVRNLLTKAQIGENFALVPNQAAYLIGVNSLAVPTDFNTVKPLSISSAYIHDANGNDYPLDLISREEYNAFPVKTNGGIPERLFYDLVGTQQANPYGTINFYPTPDSSVAYTLYLFSEKPLSRFASLDAPFTFPDEYQRAIVYNLALALTPDYGRAVHPEIASIADEALDDLESLNAANKHTVANLGLPIPSGCGNIFTGP